MPATPSEETFGAGRQRGSRPFPDLPAGTPNHSMPFEHLVVVMMENHSFDNLLGALSRSRPEVEGLTFVDDVAVDWNPGVIGTPDRVTAFPLQNTAQGSDVSQSWQESHEQINDGAMDGFVRTAKSTQPMGYYTPEILPFAYSLASTFALGNQWFSSLPGPTYPNRRFLLAGTAYGTTVTHGDPLVADSPASGTVFGLLSDNNIDWSNYFSDVPMSMVIGRDVLLHADHHHTIDKFFADCKSGSLPQVSFVDPRIGLASKIGKPIADLPSPFREWLELIDADLSNNDPAETEEDPQDMYYGESWAHSVVQAVIDSPQWPSMCLIYIYDEHGGYYDHVVPPPAIAPDDIAPVLQGGGPDVGYTQYGPRVPAIVVSPYARPGAVTDVVHDHTSVLATIEAKWNLPALTERDANAKTIMDFLDPSTPALLHPPTIATPSATGPSGPANG
jgi:phospholipase C